MSDEHRSRQASVNDNDFLRPNDLSRSFQRGHHQWEYKGNSLEESYRLQHPENRKTLARIERHDRRKGYFDGGVELLLRTSSRGSFHTGHYNISLDEAFARAERHADKYLRYEQARQPGPKKRNRRGRDERSSGERER
jgi:hypothetical protein